MDFCGRSASRSSPSLHLSFIWLQPLNDNDPCQRRPSFSCLEATFMIILPTCRDNIREPWKKTRPQGTAICMLSIFAIDCKTLVLKEGSDHDHAILTTTPCTTSDRCQGSTSITSPFEERCVMTKTYRTMPGHSPKELCIHTRIHTFIHTYTHVKSTSYIYMIGFNEISLTLSTPTQRSWACHLQIPPVQKLLPTE